MWNFLLTTFYQLPSPVILSEDRSRLVSESKDNNSLLNVAQTTNLVEAVSPLGYSLKHPDSWKRFTAASADPNSDILLGRTFAIPSGEIVVTITTTMRNFLVLPRELPATVRKFDKVTEIYTGILSQGGYKISDIREMMIKGRRAMRFVAESPDNRGVITVLVEGEDEKMVVSTGNYPLNLNNSRISREILEQVVAEIGLIQNSITISKE
jgi:hypothetical protein